MHRNTKVILAISVLAILALVYLGYKAVNAKGEYDNFAKCLTSKGVKMYGTYWCGHCKNQKLMFGISFKRVDYVECTKRKDECDKAGIKVYPTWIFQNGERYEGEMPLDKISKLSGCEL